VNMTNSSNPHDRNDGWFHRRAADALLLLSLLVAIIPETWLPEQVISGAQHALWPYLLATVFIFTGYVGRRQGMHPMLALLCFGALWMLALGCLSMHDHGLNKSFGGDLAIFSAAIGGFMWAAQRDIGAILFQLRAWTVVTLVGTAITIVALLAGVLETLGTGNRLLVYSIYWGTWLLTSAFPFLYATADLGADPELALRRAKWWRLIALAGLGCVLIVGLISATRSVFLSGLAGLLVLAVMEANGRRLNLKIAVVVGCLGVAAAAGTYTLRSLSSSELGARFQERSFQEDGRFIEWEEMCEELEEGLAFIHGKGFGSVFYSTAVSDGAGTYVLSPHIGILTTVFKGGICMFFLCVVVPLVRCVVGLLTSKGGPVPTAACGGVILYAVMASLSGGWDFKELFLLGMFLAIAVQSHRPMAEANLADGAPHRRRLRTLAVS